MIIPIYQKIINHIEFKIKNKELKVDELIPSETMLMDEFNTSRMTVRKAIDILEANKLVYRVKGAGTYVQNSSLNLVKSNHLKGFSNNINYAQGNISSKVLEFVVISADYHIASKLNIKEKSLINKLTRIRYVNGEAIAYQTSYTPFTMFPNLISYNLENSSLYSIFFNDYKVKAKNSKEEISAVYVNAQEIKDHLFNSNDGIALRIESIVSNDENIIFEYSISHYSASLYKVNIDINN